jgi:hypothetical protein
VRIKRASCANIGVMQVICGEFEWPQAPYVIILQRSGLLTLPAKANALEKTSAVGFSSSNSFKRSVKRSSSATKVESLNFSEMRCSPNFQALK